MIGAAVRVTADGGHWPSFSVQWAAGDSVAVLILTSSALLVRTVSKDPRWVAEAIVALLVVVPVSVAAMWSAFPSALFALPLLFAVGLRLGPPGVTLCAGS